MAKGRLSLPYRIAGLAMVVMAAGATYRLKHAVRGLDGELASLRQRIEGERWGMRAARADLEFLTRPERIVLQARQLGLVPARGDRIVALSSVPPAARLALAAAATAVVLPSGRPATLLARPPVMPAGPIEEATR